MKHYKLDFFNMHKKKSVNELSMKKIFLSI